jgi:metal-sulfur cluster biosynthetic enzyme
MSLLTHEGTHESQAYAALHAVVDPELDEPITDLGFVRSLTVSPTVSPTEPDRVEVHLRLPTSFCSPNFAYLMASDAKDALTALPGGRGPGLGDAPPPPPHDSDLINAGLAADAGYRGTFRHEAESSLDELRTTFHRKAHTAALERCLTRLLRARPDLAADAVGDVRLGDLPDDEFTASLRRRRAVLGLPDRPEAYVLVDHAGERPGDVPLALRRARSTRISIDGNAHFCRGLLATRYGEEVTSPAFVPLTDLHREGASS